MAFFVRRKKQQPKTKYYVLNSISTMSQPMSRREQVEVLRATLYSLADSLADGHHSDEQLRALDAEVARVSNVPPPAPVAQAPAQAQAPAPAPAQAQALPLNPFSRFAAPAPLYSAPVAAAPAQGTQAQGTQAPAPAMDVRSFFGEARAPLRAAPAPAPGAPGVVFGVAPAQAPAPAAPAQAPAQAQAQPHRHVAFAPGTALPAQGTQARVAVRGPFSGMFGQAPAPALPPAPVETPAEAAARWLAVGAHRRALAETYVQRYRVNVNQAAFVLDYAERNGVHPDPSFERVVRRARERAARESVARERAAKKPSKKTTVIKIADLAVVNPDSCAVCMENHCKGDEVVTNCGHRFGSACFAQWETTQLRSNKVTCPCCRVNVTQLTGFRRRAVPQKKGK